ncbi:MAG: hypothetical protein PVG86_12145 [Desulfobacterales bacterium]
MLKNLTFSFDNIPYHLTIYQLCAEILIHLCQQPVRIYSNDIAPLIKIIPPDTVEYYPFLEDLTGIAHHILKTHLK